MNVSDLKTFLENYSDDVEVKLEARELGWNGHTQNVRKLEEADFTVKNNSVVIVFSKPSLFDT